MQRRTIARAIGSVLVALALTACGSGTSPTTPSAPASAAPTPMPIVIDTDMGADDILAIAMLVHEPTVEIRAITVAGTGLAHCGAGLRNLRGLLHQLEAAEVPIGCGSEGAGPDGRPFPAEWRAGTDAGYGLTLPPVPASDAGADAVELMADVLDAAHGPVTMLVLGPWTNLEQLLDADPDAASRIARLHVMGGTLDAPGNVADDSGRPAEPALEWNLAADPSAVTAVLAHDIPVSLVSLDATDQVPLDRGVLDALAADHAGAGANLAYELFALNGYMLTGGTFLWDELAAVTLVEPDLVTWESVQVAVDGAGHVSRESGGRAVEISMDVDPDPALDAVLAALRRGPPRADPFTIAGDLALRWDGTSCTMTAPDGSGYYTATAENASAQPAAVYAVTVADPHSWADVEDFVASLVPGAPIVVPEWLATPIEIVAEPGMTVEAGGRLHGALVGPVCATGVDTTAPTFVLGTAMPLGE